MAVRNSSNKLAIAGWLLIVVGSIYAIFGNIKLVNAMLTVEPTKANTVISFANGNPGKINVTINKTQKLVFTNPGITNDTLDLVISSGQHPVYKPDTGTTLCGPLDSTDPRDVWSDPYGSTFITSSELIVTFSGSKPNYKANVQFYLTVGDQPFNCAKGKAGPYDINTTYTVSTPIEGQGSEFTDVNFDGALFEFVNAATIKATLKITNGADVGKTKAVEFVDSDAPDYIREYRTQSPQQFCHVPSDQTGAGKLVLTNPSKDADTQMDIKVTMSYFDPADGKCKWTNLNKKVKNRDSAARRVMEWNITDIISSYPKAAKLSPVTVGSAPSTTLFASSSGGCDGYGLQLTADDRGPLYEFDGKGSSSGPFSNCKLKAAPRIVIISGTRGQVTDLVCPPNNTPPDPSTGKCPDGSEPVPNPDPDPNPNPTPTPGDATCESNGFLKLEWLLCPVLRGIDKAVTSFYSEVNDQLCVKIKKTTPGDKITEGGGTCSGSYKDILEAKSKSSNASAHDAWSAMRVIATSTLVIVMLVAIVGQAFGGKA